MDGQRISLSHGHGSEDAKSAGRGASYGKEEKEGLKMDSEDGTEISSKAKQELAERNRWPEWLGTSRIEEL